MSVIRKKSLKHLCIDSDSDSDSDRSDNTDSIDKRDSKDNSGTIGSIVALSFSSNGSCVTTLVGVTLRTIISC